MGSGTPARLSLTESAAGFFDWWREELLGLVPQWLRRLLADAEVGVVLAQLDGGFQIFAAASPRTRGEAAPLVLTRAQALAALADMAASRRASSIGLRLPLC
jgi:hypothetical protein